MQMWHRKTIATLSAFILSVVANPAISRAQNRPPAVPTISPLTEAVWLGDQAHLRQLLAAGEDPTKVDDQDYTPWMWAIVTRDTPSTSLLLSGIRSLPPLAYPMLPIAAGQNDLTTARQLLDKGVPPDATATGGGHYSALLVAASSGYVQMMSTLLDAGANPNWQDQHGDTPLMAAVRIGSVDGVRLLLARGANANVTDELGRTALTWAGRVGRADMAATLRSSGARTEIAVTPAVPLSPRAAAEKSLPLLQRSASTWLEKQTCFSCHHPPMALRVAAVARERGFALDESKVRLQFLKTRGLPGAPGAQRSLASPEATLRGALGNFASSSFGNGVALSALVDFGAKRDDPDLQVVNISKQALFLARMQLPDGGWRSGGPRLPIESNDFTATANAARALRAYGAPEDATEMSERVGRARAWLLRNTAVTTDEEVFRLLGMYWTDAEQTHVRQQAEILKGEQNRDGGWAQLPGMNSDAYATGLVLVALHQSGFLANTDERYQRGVGYLVSTQEADGSWLVTKRAVPGAIPWFDTGFPHGKFQTISYVGTAWATMALMYAAQP
jgi:N-acyl-D-amino-acid deacylase